MHACVRTRAMRGWLVAQITCNYVAMTPSLRIFDSSVDKGAPYDIR